MYITWEFLQVKKKLKRNLQKKLFKKFQQKQIQPKENILEDEKNQQEQQQENIQFSFEDIKEYVQDCLEIQKYKLPTKFDIIKCFQILDQENNNFIETKQILEMLQKQTEEVQSILNENQIKKFMEFNCLDDKDKFYYDDYTQDTDIFLEQHKKQNLMIEKPYQLNKLKVVQKRGKKIKINIE